MEHFSAMKFAMDYEKWGFLWYKNLQNLEKKNSWKNRTGFL